MTQAVNRRALLAGGLASAGALGLTISALAKPALANRELANNQQSKSATGPVQLFAKPETTARSPAARASLWGYNAVTPGPILRVGKGEELFVRLKNDLAQPTSIHWRGMRGPNTMDGVAGLTQPAIQPGAYFDYRFGPPDAGTFVYHAHAGPYMAEQFHRGLSGMCIVGEEQPPDVDADIPLAIGDWLLGPGGMLKEPVNDPADAAGPGRLGNVFTVNGKADVQPQTLAPGARVRLRIANLAPARIIGVLFAGMTPKIIAIDGQPCKIFSPDGNAMPLAPGGRFDAMFDVPGEAGAMASVALFSWPYPGEKPRKPQSVFQITPAGKAHKKRPQISGLPDNPLLPQKIRLQDAKRKDIVLDKAPARYAADGNFWMLDGKVSDGLSGPALFSVPVGQPVSLGFQNRTHYPQVIRIHGHTVRRLHLFDDGWEPYWLDTILIPPGKTVRVAFIADNRGKWRIGSAIMAHATAGMAGWFQVI